MKRDDPSPTLREHLEERVVALLLGELGTDEAEEVKRLISNDPVLASHHRRMKKVLGLVEESVLADHPETVSGEDTSPAQLSEARRQSLLATFQQSANSADTASEDPVQPVPARDRVEGNGFSIVQLLRWVPFALAACLVLGALIVFRPRLANVSDGRMARKSDVEFMVEKPQDWKREESATEVDRFKLNTQNGSRGIANSAQPVRPTTAAATPPPVPSISPQPVESPPIVLGYAIAGKSLEKVPESNKPTSAAGESWDTATLNDDSTIVSVNGVAASDSKLWADQGNQAPQGSIQNNTVYFSTSGIKDESRKVARQSLYLPRSGGEASQKEAVVVSVLEDQSEVHEFIEKAPATPLPVTAQFKSADPFSTFGRAEVESLNKNAKGRELQEKSLQLGDSIAPGQSLDGGVVVSAYDSDFEARGGNRGWAKSAGALGTVSGEEKSKDNMFLGALNGPATADDNADNLVAGLDPAGRDRGRQQTSFGVVPLDGYERLYDVEIPQEIGEGRKDFDNDGVIVSGGAFGVPALTRPMAGEVSEPLQTKAKRSAEKSEMESGRSGQTSLATLDVSGTAGNQLLNRHENVVDQNGIAPQGVPGSGLQQGFYRGSGMGGGGGGGFAGGRFGQTTDNLTRNPAPANPTAAGDRTHWGLSQPLDRFDAPVAFGDAKEDATLGEVNGRRADLEKLGELEDLNFGEATVFAGVARLPQLAAQVPATLEAESVRVRGEASQESWMDFGAVAVPLEGDTARMSDRQTAVDESQVNLQWMARQVDRAKSIGGGMVLDRIEQKKQVDLADGTVQTRPGLALPNQRLEQLAQQVEPAATDKYQSPQLLELAKKIDAESQVATSASRRSRENLQAVTENFEYAYRMQPTDPAGLVGRESRAQQLSEIKINADLGAVQGQRAASDAAPADQAETSHPRTATVRSIKPEPIKPKPVPQRKMSLSIPSVEEDKPVADQDLKQIEKATDARAKKLQKELSQVEVIDEALEAEQVSKPAPKAPPRPPADPLPEIQTVANPFSTFSLNVSDVAFKLASASLQNNQMPDPGTVRSEEFLNAFNYHDPAPAPGAKLAFAWNQARNPFEHNRDLVRFSIQTAAWGRETGQPLNLVLLLDNSGSMERADRVQIVREAMRILARQLTPQDRVSVVAFARTPRLWVDGMAGGSPDELVEKVGHLNPQGGTNLELALTEAYATAKKHFMPNGNNRVILMTDGAANLGNVDPSGLKAKVELHRGQGVATDCYGIGWEGYNDELMETLSRNGDGRYGFINTPYEAATGFADQLAGALRVAAANVKAQIEFNPLRVTTYRQIGYEKHQLTKEQFRDNKVDAAEIGAAESGTALYSIQVNPKGNGPLGVVRVRFKNPASGVYEEKEWPLPYNTNVPSLDQAYPSMRLAASASAFAEWLTGSPYAGNVTLPELQRYLAQVPSSFPLDPRPQQLLRMIQQARALSGQ